MLVLLFGWLHSHAGKPAIRSCVLVTIVIITLLSTAFEYTGTTNKVLVTIQKYREAEIYQSYFPHFIGRQQARYWSSGIVITQAREFSLPAACANRNASIWKTCDSTHCKSDSRAYNRMYPHATSTGEKTSDFIHRVLDIAWGKNPPSIDLYVRAGCSGTMELRYLFDSIELFWPRFLGSVVLVLDVGDEAVLKHLLPAHPRHHYLVAFEHQPCMPGRVFNQYSHLNLDRHCTADYVVAIDSDCVLHSPVTPDLIFRHGRIILPSTRRFQKEMWRSSVDAMLGVGIYDGHGMTTQPLVFALSTFPTFRKWFHESKGVCYEDRLATLSPKQYPTFCWMCQIGTYLERGQSPRHDHDRYWYYHLEDSSVDPMIRYSLHVTYEPYQASHCTEPVCYEKSVNEIIRQGLCRAFGSSIFRVCANQSDLAYVNEVTFLYTHKEVLAANTTARSNALMHYLGRLKRATTMALRQSANSTS